MDARRGGIEAPRLHSWFSRLREELRVEAVLRVAPMLRRADGRRATGRSAMVVPMVVPKLRGCFGGDTTAAEPRGGGDGARCC